MAICTGCGRLHGKGREARDFIMKFVREQGLEHAVEVDKLGDAN